jgi:hypothetical protein
MRDTRIFHKLLTLKLFLNKTTIGHHPFIQKLSLLIKQLYFGIDNTDGAALIRVRGINMIVPNQAWLS